MAREARWTYEQVAAEADAIRAEGGRPSARLIQRRFGGGSMGAIHRLFREWEASRGRPRAAMIEIPDAVRNALVDFIEAETSTRMAELEAKVASAQTAADDAEKARTELAKAHLQIDDLPRLRGEASKVPDLAAQKADLTARLELITRQLADAEAKLAQALAKVDDVAGDRDRIRADLAAAASAAKVLDAQNANLVREQAKAEQEREREVTALKERIAEIAADRDGFRAAAMTSKTKDGAK